MLKTRPAVIDLNPAVAGVPIVRFRRRCRIWWLVLTLAILANDRANAGDWPGFRGPNQDGSASGEVLADTWPADGPPVLWSREIGQGYSGLAMVGEFVLTQTQTLYEQQLICLQRDTGKTVWTVRYDWPYDGGGLYPGPRATPAVAGKHVYFVSPGGETGCVELHSGRRLWSRNFRQLYRSRGADFGAAASPLVWRNRLILPVGGEDASLIAVDPATGELLWRCGSQPASYTTPLVVPWQDRWLVIAPLENSLLCADAETGEKHWELNLSSGYDEHSCAPVYREPHLLLAGPFRSGADCWTLVRNPDTGLSRPARHWQSTQFSNDVASSLLVDDLLLGFDIKDMQAKVHRPSRGMFRCLDWNTGELLWSSAVPGHGNLIAADNRLLLFNDRGELQLARADRSGYHQSAQVSVFPETVSWTAPALSEGRLLLRAGTRLACLYVGHQPLADRRSVQTVSAISPPDAWNAASWLRGEREFPATIPDAAELWPWYWSCMAGLGTAWLLSLVSDLWSIRRCRKMRDDDESASAPRPVPGSAGIVHRSDALFLTFTLIWGLMGSRVLNPALTTFVFTWPLALWALLHTASLLSLQAGFIRRTPRDLWLARGSLLGLIAGSALYFHGCRQLGMAMEWIYLAIFPAALPLSFCGGLAAWRWPRSRIAIRLIAAGASWTVYFWTAAAVLMFWYR